jgi:hypothetical protein
MAHRICNVPANILAGSFYDDGGNKKATLPRRFFTYSLAKGPAHDRPPNHERLSRERYHAAKTHPYFLGC